MAVMQRLPLNPGDRNTGSTVIHLIVIVLYNYKSLSVSP